MTNYMKSITFYLLAALMLVGCKVEEKAATRTPNLLPLARTTTFTNGVFELGSDVKINIEAPEEDRLKLQNLLNSCLDSNTASKGNTLKALNRPRVTTWRLAGTALQ